MQPIAKLQNSNTLWTSKLRPRVGDTVISSGIYYSNIPGYNDVVTNTNVWFPISNQAGGADVPITKIASDITGSDPFYMLDLSAYTTLPALPSKLLVYIDQLGDGNYLTMDPIAYNATTKVLSGMNSPTDFPDQIIKVFIS